MRSGGLFDVTSKSPAVRFALIAAVGALVLAPAAFADRGGGGNGKPGSGGSSCTLKAPGVIVDNNWQWGSPGSWGLPSQQLTYAIHLSNYDVGCGSSSFVITVSAPNGFSVSIPTNTIALKSSSSAYLWAYVTAPSVIADGDYPLTVSVARVGTSSSMASYTSYYKVYSSDTVAPTLYWPNPWDGQAISGRSSFNVTVSTSDDHAVNKIDLYIDNVYMSTKSCSNVSYSCQLNYSWSPNGVGQHTATFKSYDWMGNVGVLTVTFTVS